MNIVGENLVLSLENGGRSALYFFNWLTGKLKSVGFISRSSKRAISELSLYIVQPPFQDEGYSGLVFLRHDLLVHPSFEGRCFNIYHVTPATEGGDVKVIQRLSFPEPFPYECTSIEARGSPNVTENGSFPKYFSSERPYLDRPQDAIILFTFNQAEHLPQISMITHRRSLVQLLPPRSEWSQTGGPVVLAWNEWGPNITRWIDNDPPSRFTTFPYGQRYVRVGETFAVFDFNPYYEEGNDQDESLYLIPFNESFPNQLPFAFHSSGSDSYDEVDDGIYLSETGMVSFEVS